MIMTNSKGDFLIPIEVIPTGYPRVFKDGPYNGDQIFIPSAPAKGKIEISLTEYEEYLHLKRLIEVMTTCGVKEWSGYSRVIDIIHGVKDE